MHVRSAHVSGVFVVQMLQIRRVLVETRIHPDDEQPHGGAEGDG